MPGGRRFLQARPAEDQRHPFPSLCRLQPVPGPTMNGRVERMQATLRNEFQNVRDTAVQVSGLRPLTDEYMAFHSTQMAHDAPDGLTPDEYLQSRRIRETLPPHMS